MRHARFCRFACCCLVLPYLAGCGTKAEPMLISVEQEIAVGREVARQVEREYGRPLDTGPRRQRVRSVFGRVVARAQRKVPYSVTVLDNEEVVNAVACPGGPVYVTSALCDTMTGDGELAFVLGHEVGHIEGEHGRLAINRAVLAGVAMDVALRDAGELARTGASAVWLLYARGYSRAHEREADSTGLRLMRAAGYPAADSLAALRKLGGGEHHGPTRYLATHPSTPERLGRLEAEIEGTAARP